MELSNSFIDNIKHIVEEYQKPFGTGTVLWYHLKWYKSFSHQDDINRLADCHGPKIDALCLIVDSDYIFDTCTFIIVHEKSELAKPEYYLEEWHDEISMTEFKKSKKRALFLEDRDQTMTIINVNDCYEFHLWKSPRRIKAVTDRCKNFGDIWLNGVCVHEGNKYGDHEHFYVVGTIHQKKFRP